MGFNNTATTTCIFCQNVQLEDEEAYFERQLQWTKSQYLLALNASPFSSLQGQKSSTSVRGILRARRQVSQGSRRPDPLSRYLTWTLQCAPHGSEVIVDFWDI
ncbi:hypothetical protein BYT27DRAFT_6795278 [Phlegmacium glaucopus]|nr:hypothetical protein BYT27DRAFT_6795278 [Phlegmacium glaucopus]